MVDDGIQPPVELSCKERNILAATFIRSLHKNIGKGGEDSGLWGCGATEWCSILCLRPRPNEPGCSSGGSETFQDKVNFFQRELRQVHIKRPHSKVTLKVSRHALLESVGSVSSLCAGSPAKDFLSSCLYPFSCLFSFNETDSSL